jgi:hypothetical protein
MLLFKVVYEHIREKSRVKLTMAAIDPRKTKLNKSELDKVT